MLHLLFNLVSLATPAAKIEDFVTGIRRLIEDSPQTYKKWYRVRLDDFGEYGLNILVNFSLDKSDKQPDQPERQQILLGILMLAETMGIQLIEHGLEMSGGRA